VVSALFENPFEIVAPREQKLPFIFNSAHSGRFYPNGFLAQSRLNQHELRRSEDCFVDILIGNAPSLGAPLLKAHFPRAYLDANREPYELDPKMFEGRLPSYANIRSVRVAGGLGAIPRIVAEGQEIYISRLPVAEAMERIDRLYRPYHRALRSLLTKTHQRFGEAYLFDCHSMPSASLGLETMSRPDIVLGDRFGTSCSSLFIDSVQKVFEGLGYTVARNRPYAGGFITEHYGNPAADIHAIQIEINRSLYMNEDSLEPHADFSQLQRNLTDAIERIWELLQDQNGHFKLAAE
jgi:N-formylglutamate amidohydrolase